MIIIVSFALLVTSDLVEYCLSLQKLTFSFLLLRFADGMYCSTHESETEVGLAALSCRKTKLSFSPNGRQWIYCVPLFQKLTFSSK